MDERFEIIDLSEIIQNKTANKNLDMPEKNESEPKIKLFGTEIYFDKHVLRNAQTH